MSTQVEDIPALVRGLHATFRTNVTRDIHWRKQQLLQLQLLLTENKQQLAGALKADLGRNDFLAISEVMNTVKSINEVLKDIDHWISKKSVSVPLLNKPGDCFQLPQPLGVVLVIGPWNYPVELVISPLIGAISAGNCVVIKPSEIASHTSALLNDLIPKYLDNDCFRVVEGAIPETTALLSQKWDHIFYTGNGVVGRIVMKAAANNLTPVTLELGGKSPTIIDKDANLHIAALRIANGKFLNCGQTCVAPDYILVHEDIEEEFVALLKETVTNFYGEDPQQSPSYDRIISKRHLNRIQNLLEGQNVDGGIVDENDKYLSPTFIHNPPLDSPIMNDEIFGPVLPIISIPHVDYAIDFVNDRPRPLALYVFTENQDTAQKVLRETTSGGACVNDTFMQVLINTLPFGGVGESGMGSYHGKASFDTFTHYKSVFDASTKVDTDLRYPPFTDRKSWWAQALMFSTVSQAIQSSSENLGYIAVGISAPIIGYYISQYIGKAKL
eukprot:TRINITY_DN321_c0_g1_i1.p1 TRINITY_DN321_c0_g1~~TRINITY_DN321_c0_g1_i1.p1  ORF type:complete len:499 (-),score=121.39 TRINITY_DN321_c0_g1_i1:43-1539(-)